MGGKGRSFGTQVLVFAASVLYLGWGVWQVPLASGYTDPVSKVRPQDEALYSGISMGMAERGEWLTPRFLGRLAFVKPILAFLPTALAVRLFGDSLWSLRLFSVLCGAGVLTLLWRWKGVLALLLLATNPLFFTLARRNMTDVPVLCAVLLSLYLWDKSERGAGAALAWGVLTKSVAGALPALFLWKGWGRVVGFAVLLVLPWHLYQLAVNGDWYWKEHVLDEHLQWGLRTPENAAAEGHLPFYLSRAWEIDPLLAILAPLALAYCVYRKRYMEAGWLAVSVAVLFAFGYRNATYLLPVFAATALAAGGTAHPAAAAALLGLRLLTGSISHAATEPVAPAAALTEYRALGRANGLIIDGVEDELVATTMHLARVQYILPGDARTLAATNIDFAGRGIIAEGATYRGLPEPLETVLLVRSAAELQNLLDAAGNRDFLLRAERMGALQLGSRIALGPKNGWVAVLAVP
ncbi:MAG: ArnT family glycosyltransferase [Bryobacteraceae bacterium]